MLGRITSETKKTAANVVISSIANTYDKAGNRLTVTYPGNRVLSSSYDKRNMLKTLVDGASTSSYTYDANGNRLTLTLSNGVVTSTAFDNANRVLSIENAKEGVQIYKSVYKMDKISNRLNITESRNGQPDRVLVYTYDKTYQMLTESDGTNTTSFVYDATGNRLTKSVNGTVTNYTTDKLNRVLSAVTGSDSISYTYDANGNRATKTTNAVTQSYVYDRENRLVSVLEGSSPIFAAIYDYRTRRMACIENSVDTRYIYDSGDCVQERDATGSLTKQLVRGTGMGGGIGSVLYTEKLSGGNTTAEYFSYNAIGSTVSLCNASGTVTSTSSYDAWGKVTASTGATDNKRLFCTKERSEAINLDNFGKRYYDPELGRFLTRDPLGYPDGSNNYVYCNNNPINQIDPLGLVIETIWDLWNVAQGAVSCGRNVWAGNYAAAGVDALGIVVDGAATLIPGVPGGASTGIKAARAIDNAVQTTGTAAAKQAANAGKEAVEQGSKKVGKEAVEQAEKKAVKEGGEQTAKETSEQASKTAKEGQSTTKKVDQLKEKCKQW